MDKGMLISFTETIPEKDNELKEWFIYDHINERALNTEGFFRARIYQSDNFSPKYFATYETENFEVLSSKKYLSSVENQTNWSKRIIPSLTILDRMTTRTTINQINGFGNSVALVRFSPKDSIEKQNITRNIITKELFPKLQNNKFCIGGCLNENMTDIANLTGEKAKSFGANPKKISDLEWLLIFESYNEKSIFNLIKNIFNIQFQKDLQFKKLISISSYHLLYGTYK